MSGLSDLLQRLNTEAWSSRRIERETEKHGRKISYATVSRYLNGTHPQNPDAATLQSLADAFRVDVNELRKALGRPGIGEPFELGPEASRLTEPQREAVRLVVEQLVKANDAVADQPVRDGATRRLSVLPGKLSPSDREELYRRAEQVDLGTQPYAAAGPEDDSDDDESV